MLFQSLDLTLKESFKNSNFFVFVTKFYKGFHVWKRKQKFSGNALFSNLPPKIFWHFFCETEKLRKSKQIFCDSLRARLAQLFCKSDFRARCQESNRKNNLKVNQNELLLCLSIRHMCYTV